jgi:hypothetical protein
MVNVERRRNGDRRSRPTPLVCRYYFRGRRRAARRAGEARNCYVDRYDAPLALAALLILVLSILDAFFTLSFLARGGEELNPIVQNLIEAGPRPFVAVKAIVTGLCVLFLIAHKNFLLVRQVLGLVLSFYTLLLVYHLYLHTI